MLPVTGTSQSREKLDLRNVNRAPRVSHGRGTGKQVPVHPHPLPLSPRPVHIPLSSRREAHQGSPAKQKPGGCVSVPCGVIPGRREAVRSTIGPLVPGTASGEATCAPVLVGGGEGKPRGSHEEGWRPEQPVFIAQKTRRFHACLESTPVTAGARPLAQAARGGGAQSPASVCVCQR